MAMRNSSAVFVQGTAADGSAVAIRRLTREDAPVYREIRLEGLRDSPEAFGSTFENESANSLEFFSERIATSNVFGAFRNAELAGVAGLLIHQGVKEAHKGFLWGMYVRPSARHMGAGRLLVEAVLAFARTKVELVQLSVISENVNARRLYAAMGFVEYGLEKKSLKQNGRYHDEVLMAKDLLAG
jgi:ribosomal protein S18 acetylase RimI-like enzyme